VHYTQDGSPVLRQERGHTLSKRVRDEYVPSIPADTTQSLDRFLPLRYNNTVDAVILETLPHLTGETDKSAAVYVLECRHNSRAVHDAFAELNKGSVFWDRDNAATARRLIYVGVTTELIRRLYNHLNNPREGGDFPTVHPPLRVLSVFWFGSYKRAHRAEKLIADGLQERFDEDHVVQA